MNAATSGNTTQFYHQQGSDGVLAGIGLVPTENTWKIALALAVVFATLWYNNSETRKLRHIPTEGSSSLPILSLWGAYNLVFRSTQLLGRAYTKHKGGLFKVAILDRWLVFTAGAKLVDEIQKLPDEQVSFVEAVDDAIGFTYIFGPRLRSDPIHVPITRNNLTRNLGPVFADMYDEINTSFEQLVPADADGSGLVLIEKLIRTVISRTSNRVFIGLPLCRDPGYLDVSINSTLDFGAALRFLAIFPPALKPYAAKFISSVDRCVAQSLAHLGPTIEDRIRHVREFGDAWADKPNDMLQWIVDEICARPGFGAEDVVRFLLFINFAAIDTTAATTTHALYDILSHPEHIPALRTEAERVIGTHGWTKDAIDRLELLDSFLRESQRYNGINIASIYRKALVPLTLSNGVHIPQGTIMVTPALATHFDAEYYEDPDAFDPLRAYRKQRAGAEAGRYHAVTTSADYLSFGHGRHACPGRFFAALEAKALLAYILINYDFGLEQGGSTRPPNRVMAVSIGPDPTVRLRLHRREPVLH